MSIVRSEVLAIAWLLSAAACTGTVGSGGPDDADAGASDADAGSASDSGPDPDGGGTDAGPGTDAGLDAGSDAGIPADPLGQLSKDLRVDNFGWRTTDKKVAVLLGHAGAAVELRRASDNFVAGSYTASGLTLDEDSGDQVATVDFSAHTTPGDFYLYLPGPKLRSYSFRVADDVFDIVGEAAVKSYYFQRCNHDKALPYAGDALGGYPGHGGRWVDGSCHATDSSAPPGPGSADHGNLDVHGGWHDAGDYQKTLWGRGVPQMLFAYEVNPSAWRDGQLNLPESGNGIPDLLDEVRWELDFYVRMQRPDGHFMSSTKGANPTRTSPPSQSDEGRVYFDCTSPSGGAWSGGGVTLAEATGNAVLSLAHAAIVFRSIGQATIGDGYAAAAASGWSWLSGQTLSGDPNRLKAAAASAVYRMDPAQASAAAFADAFAWDTFDGLAPYSVTPAESVVSVGAFHYLANAAGSAAVKAKVRTGIAAALVDRAFEQAGAYGGMFGDATNAWDWSWGSNRQQGAYGANLLMAAHFGVLGAHSAAEVAVLAQQHFHYLLGLNPLNMVYLTSMAAYGGEHSSFQLYHGWFSYTGNDGDHGNASYNGKPGWVVEPLYPYYADDAQASTYGPAPGLVPGGPNFGYSGSYVVPHTFPAYAYRDFSVGCDWSGSACRAASWEITEPMAAYQGPFVLLAAFMMSGS